MASDEPEVTYTVREMLARQDLVLEGIDRKLEDTASKADLNALATRIDKHGRSIALLEEDKRNRDRFKRGAAWATGIAATAFSGLVALGALTHVFH